MYKLVTEEQPPLNVLVRTHVGEEDNTQKAILKEDGWYYPSGETKLPWIPLYWINI